MNMKIENVCSDFEINCRIIENIDSLFKYMEETIKCYKFHMNNFNFNIFGYNERIALYI